MEEILFAEIARSDINARMSIRCLRHAQLAHSLYLNRYNARNAKLDIIVPP